jgi:molybdenum cofactor synthesis domain-containing protein
MQTPNPSPPKACIIIIGNEILSGRTEDKNITWLASELGKIGVSTDEVRIIPDYKQVIADTVKSCSNAFNYVFTTGGIGPTHDDITSVSIALAFDVPIIRNAEAEAILEKYYGKEELNAARLKMAEIPQNSRLIYNPVSAAPGFIIKNVYAMAGVPEIMQAMFADIKGELRGGAKILSRTLSVYITEGFLAEGLTNIQNQLSDVEIGSYPFIRNGRLGTSLVSRSSDEALLNLCYDMLKNFLLTITPKIEED